MTFLMNITKYITLIGILFFVSCEDTGPLPYLGQKIENAEGKMVNHKIRDFKYLNQDSTWITNQSLSEYIYIADFFFTSCPSICPKVTKEMLKIYEEFEAIPQVKIVSFTLDPKRDTPNKLNLYATNLEVTSDKWLFLTGDKDNTLELASDFFVVAMEDEKAPGGFNHSGTIVLVDKMGHVRSFSDGTDPSTTPKLIKDVKTLLKEYEK